MLKRFSKVDFVDYKAATIQRRILRRMNINQISELADYAKLLHRKPEEVEALYRDVLINVTSFFRNPEVDFRVTVSATVLLIAAALNYLMLRFAHELNIPYLQAILASARGILRFSHNYFPFRPCLPKSE